MSLAITELAAFAERLADASGPIARGYFRSGLNIDIKADDSPVTRADREVEAHLREMIAAAYPDHGIIGEEHGSTGADREYVWILDPIDGTKAFITGRPLFGTLIGLLRDGQPILGVIDHPALNERWIGGLDYPTRFCGAPARTRVCATVENAILAATAPEMFVGKPAFEGLRQRVKLPVWGGDCFNYGLVASGHLDLAVEAGMAIYDYLPLVPVITAAGGVITDWRGQALGLDSGDEVLAAGDPALHRAAVAILRG